MDLNRDAYNKFKNSTGFGYKVLEYLILNNELIWKLLNSPDAGAWSEPDLTNAEKASLIYNGIGDQGEFRVFRQIFMEDASNNEISQLRIQIDSMRPETRIHGTVDFIIQVLSHNKIQTLSNYTNRTEVLQQQVIETLNGAEVEGVGVLYFNQDETIRHSSRLNIFNSKNYLGYTIVMSVKTA